MSQISNRTRASTRMNAQMASAQMMMGPVYHHHTASSDDETAWEDVTADENDHGHDRDTNDEDTFDSYEFTAPGSYVVNGSIRRPSSPSASSSSNKATTSPRKRKVANKAAARRPTRIVPVVNNIPRDEIVSPLAAGSSSSAVEQGRLGQPSQRGSVVFPSTQPPKHDSIASRGNSTFLFDKDELLSAFGGGVQFTIKYLHDIFATVIHLLRKPLALFLFVYILALIIAKIWSTLQGALAPLCYVPGISSTAFCRYPSSLSGMGRREGNKPTRWADFPGMVKMQSETFEQLLDQTAGGSGLSLEIKKAEMATADLVTLVRVSELNSKEVLASSLMEFVNDARVTGRGLSKLGSKIGGAVDSILAVNDYALHAIEAAQNKNTISLPGRIARALIPWPSPRSPTTEVVTRTFTDAMALLSHEMQRLILEAEYNLSKLDVLEEHLLTLHELIVREDASLSAEKSELLAELWTMLGGNKGKVRGMESHLGLLRGVGEYRKRALAHVVGALQTLRAMSDDMEDLRERVAAPELVGGGIPVEVHMRSIKMGLERLKEGRMRAKELEEKTRRKVLEIDGDDGEE